MCYDVIVVMQRNVVFPPFPMIVNVEMNRLEMQIFFSSRVQVSPDISMIRSDIQSLVTCPFRNPESVLRLS